jgi:23S rRNA (pseudouridine1915-N3)-methyltransferase
MRVTIVAVGRARERAFRDLWLDYAGRCQPPLDLREVEDKKRGSPAEIKEREGKLLLDAVPDGALIVALDPRGKMLDSPGFARQLGQWRDAGERELAILIGGADGLAEEVLARARFSLSLGLMTLPHQLARIVLAEQLYRAETILAGHPYHRE